ncbi:fumarylacetoacetate hydrolase family protein [Flocculibacter collagenilyticus]|uniref:fumarylacetoacetate hydrolase family protein n=1 Tax=Flocculibacter collagenilyticus TaxID=2744479 RepID=UPI0018F6D95C|nr:fumarylacetoacetate hydrolase family protein [Flocculibacter collagenilyticus]
MHVYHHKSITNEVIELPSGKVICIGQNYVDHIEEMNSVTAPEALFFIKPTTSVCCFNSPIKIPVDQGECHNEVEITALISKPLKNASLGEVESAIWGLGIGLDLTLRDVQARLKKLGRPWEVAKGFDFSAPLSPFVPFEELKVHNITLDSIEFELLINQTVRQKSNSSLMIRSICQQIKEMSEHFTLLPGDVVMTGTPAGVGPLYTGDNVVMKLANKYEFTSHVIAAN